MAPRRKKIYEGKAKILYEGPEPGTLVQYFKDDATAFNAQKKAVIEGKGVLNNRLSEFFMTGLTNIGIPNHFIRRINITNARVTVGDGTMTDALAARDMLRLRHSLLTDAAAAASGSGQAYPRQMRSELRQFSALPVAQLRERADDVARELRELDSSIQQAN